MFSTLIEQVKADYSWYGSLSNPVKFLGRVIYHPYLRLLLIFRLLTNVRGLGETVRKLSKQPHEQL